MLVAIFGLPGSGKTTFGKLLAHRLKGIHLNSDIVRSVLNLRSHYDPDSKDRVYEALFSEVRKQLERGKNVVVDATFHHRARRDQARELANQLEVPIFWIELRADEKEIRKRIALPRLDSEADFSVFQLIQAQMEPMEADHLILRSDLDSMDQMLGQATEYIGGNQTR